MVLLTATCFGQGVGPPAVGILNDALKNDFGNDAVRYSLPSAGVTTTLGAFLFVWTARFIRADIKRAPLWPCPLIFLLFFPGVTSEILVARCEPAGRARETGPFELTKPFWGTHETERKQSGRKSITNEEAS
jgi:hypothetical protein